MRQIYDATVKEPLPDWAVELLEKLDGKPPASDGPGRGNGTSDEPTAGG